MTPKRIQRKRTKGWRMPEGAVYVGRPSRWGNWYKPGETYMWLPGLGWPIPTWREPGPVNDTAARVERCPDVATSIAWYALWVAQPGVAMVTLTPASLRGRDLACWCPLDQPCHADVLLVLANR